MVLFKVTTLFGAVILSIALTLAGLLLTGPMSWVVFLVAPLIGGLCLATGIKLLTNER